MFLFHRLSQSVTYAVTDLWKKFMLLFPLQVVTEGLIVGKEEQPERKWIKLVGGMVGSRSPMSRYIPFFHRDDEDWILIIQVQYQRPSGRVFYKKHKIYLSDKARWEKVREGEIYFLHEGDSQKDPDESHLATSKEQDTYPWFEPRE